MKDPTDKTSDRLAGLLRDRASTLFGKYRGTVSKVGTGADLGKLRAYIPSVLGEYKESIWIEPAVPFAGNKHGIMFLPEVGDGVWVEFEAGHPWLPIWTGFWWGKDQKPAAASEKVRVITTSHGHQIVLDLDDPARFEPDADKAGSGRPDEGCLMDRACGAAGGEAEKEPHPHASRTRASCAAYRVG